MKSMFARQTNKTRKLKFFTVDDTASFQLKILSQVLKEAKL